MKKIIVNMGGFGDFVMEITKDEYRRGEFYIPVPKVLSALGNYMEPMLASNETTTKRLVFRCSTNEVFNLIGWE